MVFDIRKVQHIVTHIIDNQLSVNKILFSIEWVLLMRIGIKQNEKWQGRC